MAGFGYFTYTAPSRELVALRWRRCRRLVLALLGAASPLMAAPVAALGPSGIPLALGVLAAWGLFALRCAPARSGLDEAMGELADEARSLLEE